MAELGKAMIGIGVVIAVIGVAVWIAGRTGLPLGRLPGDMAWHGRNVRVYFPLGTSILLSLLLTGILYLIARFRR